MRPNFLRTNSLNTPRGPGHPGEIPGTSQIPLFETQGRQTFEGEHEVFGHHPFAWKSPTPPGCLRTQKVNLCALLSCLDWSAANGGVTNGGLRGVWPPVLEIGRNRPFPPFFCLFRPFPEGPKRAWKIQKTEEKGLFSQISSDLLKPPSLKPPFAALQLNYRRKIRARLQFSSEIDNFKRDALFPRFGLLRVTFCPGICPDSPYPLN